jgi:hypothetical protein
MGRMKTNLEKIPSGMTWPFSLCSQYSWQNTFDFDVGEPIADLGETNMAGTGCNLLQSLIGKIRGAKNGRKNKWGSK